MATIIPRETKSGERRWLARVRVRRDGRVYSESRTFGSKKAAGAWARAREVELEQTGIPRRHAGVSVAEACGLYVDDLEATPRGVGRSKGSALRRMARDPVLAEVDLASARAADWLEYLRSRYSYEIEGRVVTRAPATLAEDYIYIRGLIEHAAVEWGLQASMQELEAAGLQARRTGLIGASERREQRPTLEQLDAIFKYFYRDLSGRGANNVTRIPVVTVFLALIFSTRRVSELCRMRWDDLDRARQRVLIRDLKHPRHKRGNDVWLHLPDRAMALIDTMPRDNELIFPYHERSIAKQWQSARDWAGLPELRLHDLRHEGISHLFELGWDIPRVALVSGHRSWDTLRRYTHLAGPEPVDRYAGWVWLERILAVGEK